MPTIMKKRSGEQLVEISDGIDLDRIYESGQCFRWMREKDGPSSYRVLSGKHALSIRKAGDRDKGAVFQVSCPEGEWEDYWRGYFDLETSYDRIAKKIMKKKDPYLYEAARAGRGMRILKQEPFETLVSFIISQRKSIPAIRTCIEKLCRAAGERVSRETGGRPGEYAFPDPLTLAALPLKDLEACGLGYRAPYIYKTAHAIADDQEGFAGLTDLGDEDLLAALMDFPGVGKKVASCTALFGFHRMDAFPIDVWIGRVLDAHYPTGFPYEAYRPYNGLMQQYLFYYGRESESRSAGK